MCDGGNRPDDDTPRELQPEDIVDDTGADESEPSRTSERGQPRGSPSGNQQDGGGVVEQLEELPLKRGGAIGALIVFVPYLLATVVVSIIHEQDIYLDDSELGPLDAGAEVILSILSLGSPERVVGVVLGAADVDLTNVDPSDYPTFEDELADLLSLLLSTPEALLLVVYLIVPYLFFRTGGWLTTHAPEESALGYVKAGIVPVIGTLPIVAVLTLAFNVVSTTDKIVFAGLIIPAVFSGFGALTAWIYRDDSLRSSRVLGWGTVAGGLIAAMVVLPGITEADLSSSDRLLTSLSGYVEVLQLNGIGETDPLLTFLITVVLLVGAGFYRTNSVIDSIADATEGARVGASIVYGIVWAVALLLWLIPVIVILTDAVIPVDFVEPFVSEGQGVGRYDSIADYRTAILLGGVVVPALAGALGGYGAVWRKQRQQPNPSPSQQPGGDQQPHSRQPAQSEQPPQQQSAGQQGVQSSQQQHSQPPQSGQREQGGGDDGIDRRTLMIGGAGAVVAAGGAWFLLVDDSGIDTDSPAAVVESYYLAADDIDEAREALHSESPHETVIEEEGDVSALFPEEIEEMMPIDVDEVAADVDMDEGSESGMAVGDANAEVTERDLDASALSGPLAAFDTPSDDEIERIAAEEETALVEVVVEYDTDFEFGEMDGIPFSHVAATEDGEWKILV